MPVDTAVLYAGPTAHGLPPNLFDGITLAPPVRRGDIDALLAQCRVPGTIVICDGVFQVAPAVSHAEICRALDRGWQVWGVASLGAIRAYELRAEGMRGWGYVHAQFSRFADFTDDEMCLLHFPELPFFPVTEPLVNVRYALERQGRALGIPVAARRRIVAELRALWFGERTTAAIRRVMVTRAGVAARRADALLDWLAQHRVKTLDLAELLGARPWSRP